MAEVEFFMKYDNINWNRYVVGDPNKYYKNERHSKRAQIEIERANISFSRVFVLKHI